MSRVLYFDCASGASGDMLLGALVDLGLPLESLQQEMAKLPLHGYRLEARKVSRASLVATKVDVVLERGHDHGHSHGHGTHSHARGLRDILALLQASRLEARVRDRAAALFRRLAEAEAAVHGTTPEEVHFHEVGAVDSIVDIVGGVIGLTWIGAERCVASPLNLGSGTVVMSHGRFPVPPPATARLVHGASVYADGDGELLTPTGALLVTGFASAYGPLPAMRVDAVGYGAGTRDTEGRPNVLRLLVGNETTADLAPGRVTVLECAVDDMSPQLLGPLVERLLLAGALDAYHTPVYMKKGRPGVLVTVVAPPDRAGALEEMLFAETTTLGLRRLDWDRTVLERTVVAVPTPYGAIGVKIGRRAGRVYNAQPEFDDCQRAAAQAGVPVKEVWAAALSAYRAAAPDA